MDTVRKHPFIALVCAILLIATVAIGVKFKQSLPEPEDPLQKAAEQGDVEAQKQLSIKYANEEGPVALEKLKKLADKGFADAQYMIAQAYFWGRPGKLKPDVPYAMKMFIASANQGHKYAQELLGTIYLGQVTSSELYLVYDSLIKDHKAEGIELLKKSSEQENATAEYWLGVFYSRAGAEQDFNKAIEWYQKAEQTALRVPSGIVLMDSEYNIAELYENKLGNYNEAFKWYCKAADNHWSMAMFKVGLYYEKGIAVSIDYVKAAYWYEKSNQGGAVNGDALFRLGSLYLNGLGVEKDIDEAKYYFSRAERAGISAAGQALYDIEHPPKNPSN